MTEQLTNTYLILVKFYKTKLYNIIYASGVIQNHTCLFTFIRKPLKNLPAQNSICSHWGSNQIIHSFCWWVNDMNEKKSFVTSGRLEKTKSNSRRIWGEHRVFSQSVLWIYFPGLPGVSVVKNLPAMQETQIQSLGQQDPLEKKMATHSSTLAWEIPWIEEPGRLQSKGSLKNQTLLHD